MGNGRSHHPILSATETRILEAKGDEMKLTRKQELYLIDMAVQSIINKVLASVSKPEKEKKRGWTPSQRRKFKASMKKVWDKKKKSAKQ